MYQFGFKKFEGKFKTFFHKSKNSEAQAHQTNEKNAMFLTLYRHVLVQKKSGLHMVASQAEPLTCMIRIKFHFIYHNV